MINGFEQESFYRNMIYFKYPVLLVIYLLILHGCKKQPDLPNVTTNSPADISRTFVTVGGIISNNGGLPIIEKGICWDTIKNPDLSKQYISSGEEDANFSFKITGLKPNTLYFARAFATNELGISFGNEVTFTTLPVITGTVITIQPSSVSLNTAHAGGRIMDDGDAEIIQKGVCWSITPGPGISLNPFTVNGTGTEEFTSNITGLLPGTKYYVRAYIINSAGISYGNELYFNTKISDIQDNLYNTVTIGSQVWMTENLRTTRFNDNTPIPNVKDNDPWTTLETPAYCWFANDINKSEWGALYNWFTVMTEKLCPEGWHLPADSEFKTLERYLEMADRQIDSLYWRGTDQGGRIKSTTGWKEGENGINTSGFSALPYGYRYAATGAFNDLGSVTYWWSSEHSRNYAWYRRVDGNEPGIYRHYTSKKGGKFVRCVKN
ncbi:MAG: hypothetical protein GX126_02860 [Bacteroidales bacterium]|nr:hypothetical protein [Bacteroidales bacterium]